MKGKRTQLFQAVQGDIRRCSGPVQHPLPGSGRHSGHCCGQGRLCDPAFPVLTRGRFGLDFYKATGCKAFLAHDKAQLYRQLAQIAATFPVERTLTQSLIPDDGTNKTISFAAFCVDGEVKALNYTGVCEVEYLKDPGDGQYKLIEINARTWLWVGLARDCVSAEYDLLPEKEVIIISGRSYPFPVAEELSPAVSEKHTP